MICKYCQNEMYYNPGTYIYEWGCKSCRMYTIFSGKNHQINSINYNRTINSLSYQLNVSYLLNKTTLWSSTAKLQINAIISQPSKLEDIDQKILSLLNLKAFV